MKQQCVVVAGVASRFFVVAAVVPGVAAAAPRDVDKLVPPTVAGRAVKLPPPPLRFVAGVVIVAIRFVGAVVVPATVGLVIEGDPGMAASSRLLCADADDAVDSFCRRVRRRCC